MKMLDGYEKFIFKTTLPFASSTYWVLVKTDLDHVEWNILEAFINLYHLNLKTLVCDLAIFYAFNLLQQTFQSYSLVKYLIYDETKEGYCI